MPLLPLNEGDEVLHIYSYEKKQEKTSIVSLSSWNTELKSKTEVDNNDTLIRLDDPILAEAELDYKRYLCVQTLSYSDRDKLPKEVLQKIDEISELLNAKDTESTQRMLYSCGALKKMPSFLAGKIKKILNF